MSLLVTLTIKAKYGCRLHVGNYVLFFAIRAPARRQQNSFACLLIPVGDAGDCYFSRFLRPDSDVGKSRLPGLLVSALGRACSPEFVDLRVPGRASLSGFAVRSAKKMAVSAFKSTSKRGSFANAGPSSSVRQHQSEDAGRKVPSRRSRSVSAVSRSRLEEPAPMLEFLNKRDNPLFCTSSASPTDSEKSVAVAVPVAEKGGEDASGCRRGRSTSRSSSLHGQQSGHRNDCGRSLSRIDMGRRRRSVSRDHYGKPEVSTWDDGISSSSFSETEEKTIKAVFEQMKSFQNGHPVSDSGSGIYETVRTEVRRAMADIRSDLENVSV
ncbi:hypothetical protein Taro_029746 [Colocasia esculenta]|uniref:Uncharacterized protein n=1 Tax=Colocasia esculenta TaxID=4460 RepID=A0A843VS23_COLES|nr:hypothetical protein [Colocasia esculenta]